MAIENGNSSLRPIHRPPISEIILGMITDDILGGVLNPGDKIPTELELAQKLNIGRNAVREGIKMLSSLGIIEIRRGEGTFIAETISSSMLNPMILRLAFEQGTSKELIELRILLETSAAELVVDNATDGDIELLEATNERLNDAADKKIADPHLLRDLDLAVHYTLIEITHNALFEKIAKALYKLFFASIEKTVVIDPRQAYENHKMYIEAIKKRDKELARERFKQSLSVWIKYISK